MRAEQLAKKIRILVLDCDGVMTDGGLYYDHEGRMSKRFDVQDGLGIKLAQKAGIIVAVITGLDCKCVHERVHGLGIEDYFAGHFNKIDCLNEIREKYGCEWEDICFVGDDWVDLGALSKVGFPVAVENAQPEVKELARLVTKNRGGNGAVREVIRFILSSQGKLKELMGEWFR